jgi:ATP-dependent helicase Lhr and Lhr-like helicase
MHLSSAKFVTSTALDWAHPLVRAWFLSKFRSPTEPQQQGWPSILAGKTTLISAPTGSGKTLAAFLACIDQLVRKSLAGELRDETQVLYVSPLKALGNDIQKNLEQPLGEILQLAGERGLLMPAIRTAVRTGDTLMKERRAMLQQPPHILVTTPESLYILLTAGKSREILRTVETVIVDEIHAVADDKRGTHLALSLERLDALANKLPLRIGLSATLKPIELVANFLAGSARPDPVVVQIGHQREVDIAIEVPKSELGPVTSHELWEETYDRIAALVQEHRSTLIFVNTRRLAERVAHHLVPRLGVEAVATHHGSLSRKLRLAAENKLKAGEIKALVATASLELGIDVGSVELVCQIGSTRSISVAWQRVGRAGHWLAAIPKGRIFATTRDELVECAALVRALRQGDLDSLEIPENAMDILTQQLVAMCASEEWSEEQLFKAVRRTYPYRDLERSRFDAILEMLSEGINARRGRRGAYLHRNRVAGTARGRRGSRLAAITSGGAIPDNSLYTVVSEPEGAVVGTVDEDFAVESLRGDIMLLGNRSWRIRRVEAGRVRVEDAQGAPPNVPFWRGEAPARTPALSAQVADLRKKVSAMTCDLAPSPEMRESLTARAAVAWLQQECAVDKAGAEQIVEHIVAGRAVLGAVPTQKTVIAERFFDESGGMQLVIHAPFGGRINKAWGLALRKRFCRSFNLELQAAATDDGINICLAEQHSFPLADVFRFLHPSSVRQVLEQAVLDSPLFTTRWRWNAARALILLRFQGGVKVPPPIQRMRADDLLASVFPEAAACPENLEGAVRIPDHPLVNEVMKDALTEAMDVEGLREVLSQILDGSIHCVSVDTPIPSQFSHEILNANPFAYLDDAPLEERRARAVEMRRLLPDSVLSDVGRLDASAIEEIRREAWPDVRDAEELHDALQTLIALPELVATAEFAQTGLLEDAWQRSIAAWRPLFDQLVAQRRAARALVHGRSYWVTAERAKMFCELFPDAQFSISLAALESSTPAREESLLALIAGWSQHCGPFAVPPLANLFGLPAHEIDQVMLRLEGTGAALRGRFSDPHLRETEWCDRRLLARIHRLTVGKLRKEIESVSSAQFMRWLLGWQHLTPDTQLFGQQGTLEVLRQLQGYEAPANSWERQLLSRRIAGYDPKTLDQLCFNGMIAWGRMSPGPAIVDDPSECRRVVPTSAAPITFFLRDESDWMIARQPGIDIDRTLSSTAADVSRFIKERGASFFAEILRGTRKSKEEVELGLWELVSTGIITADGFDNLRALIDPKHPDLGSGRDGRRRYSAGRWSLLFPTPAENQEHALEGMCRVLLNRYGVVFREVLLRESNLPNWREILITLRRLEDRSEVRGGRFVDGFLGEQFALPAAVQSLRATRSEPPTGETITISAADPLNLVGIIVPGAKVLAVSSRFVTYRDGVALAPLESADTIAIGQAG